MTIPAEYPNDLLSNKLLRHLAQGSVPLYWFLEQLATESIYSIKDDFDRGIDERIWVTEGFEWKPDDLLGIIHGGPPGPVSIRSKNRGWMPAKRATAYIHLDCDNIAGKIEFGFAGLGAANADGGIVTDASTPSASAGVSEFAVGVRDTDNDDNFAVVSRGTGNAIGGGSIDRTINVAAGPTTLMISMNEQSETHFWVNGSLESIERSGPLPRSNLGLWFSSEGITLSVDFIQAWQERVTI